MVSAYLREPSLIPPRYDHGLRSMLRQELILEQVELDMARKNVEDDLALYRTLIAAATDPQARSELVHTLGQTNSMVRALRDRNMKSVRMLSPESRTGKMKIMYEALKETGLVDNEERTFTDEEFHEIMERMKSKEKVED